jgi:hypothetical protein
MGQLPDKGNIIGIFSKQLTDDQKRWSIYKKECYGIIKSLLHFHDLIFLNPITVYCDNNALTRVLEQHHSSITFTWKEILWRYQCSFLFINSTSNHIADLISRQTISKPISILALSVMSQNDSSERDCDGSVGMGDIDNKNHSFSLNLTQKEKVDIISKEHLLGHFSAPYVYKNLLRRGFRWSNMLKDIYEYIYRCPECLFENAYASGFVASQFYIAERPMQCVQVDLINAVPANDQGFEHIIVVLDVFSDFICLRALKEKSAQSVAAALTSIFSSLGYPESVSWDNGTEFNNQTIKELCDYLNITFHFSTPYLPTSKGRIERKNSTINLVIRKMLRNCLHRWPDLLDTIAYCINRQCSKVTQCVPFEIFFGRNDYLQSKSPNSPIQTFPEHSWKDHLQMMKEIIYPAIKKKTEQVRSKASQLLDSSRKMADLDLFKIGGQVMLKNLHRTNKLQSKFYGPYIITQILASNHFRLKDEAGNVLERDVPIEHLKPIRSPLPITLIDEQETIWNIDEILAHKKINRKTFYLIKWEGFEQLDWISEDDFVSTDMLNDYHKSISRRK